MSIHTFLLSAVMLFVSASTAIASVPDTVQVETHDTIVVCEENIDSAFSVGPCCPKTFTKIIVATKENIEFLVLWAFMVVFCSL